MIVSFVFYREQESFLYPGPAKITHYNAKYNKVHEITWFIDVWYEYSLSSYPTWMAGVSDTLPSLPASYSPTTCESATCPWSIFQSS